MHSPVKKFDHANPQGVAAWLAESDRLIWSDCAQAQRVAGAETEYASGRDDLFPGPSLLQRRVGLARAESEIAKARALASFIVDPDKRKRARKAINKIAACVRIARGV